MKKIDNSTATLTNLFTDGDPAVPTPATTLPAWYMNMLQIELVKVVEMAGITLDPTEDDYDPANVNQIAEALAVHVAGLDFYEDTGAADAYVLSVIGADEAENTAPPAYFDGMRVRFFPANSNTGAATLRVGALAIKNIKTGAGAGNDPSAEDILADYPIELVYDATNDCFKTTAARASISARGLKSGLELSNAADADHDITVSIGIARDTTDSKNLSLDTTITKQIDASWNAGDNDGGLSSSLTLSADTWYHVFIIEVGGSVDVGFDTDVDAANLVADHTATAYRRIGSVLTDGSSNIIGFTQYKNEFLWNSPPLDVDVINTPETAVLPTLSIPLGVKVYVSLTANLYGVGNYDSVYFSSPDVDDEANAGAIPDTRPLGALYSQANTGSNIALGQFLPDIRSNESSQIRYRSSTSSGDLKIMTHGWKEIF